MSAPNSQTVEVLWDAHAFLTEVEATCSNAHWGIGPLIERVRLAAVAAQSNGPSEQVAWVAEKNGQKVLFWKFSGDQGWVDENYDNAVPLYAHAPQSAGAERGE